MRRIAIFRKEKENSESPVSISGLEIILRAISSKNLEQKDFITATEFRNRACKTNRDISVRKGKLRESRVHIGLGNSSQSDRSNLYDVCRRSIRRGRESRSWSVCGRSERVGDRL